MWMVDFFICVFFCVRIFLHRVYFSAEKLREAPRLHQVRVYMKVVFWEKHRSFNPSQTVLQGELSVGRGNGGKWLKKTIS